MAGVSRSFPFSAIALLLLITSSESMELRIGGKPNSWTIPASESESLNRWAERSRFLVGDSLVWEYDGTKDSVLEVSKRDYFTCNTTSPIQTYSGGNNTVMLEHSGPYYFISGEAGHCEKGQKVIVVAMSERFRQNVGIALAPSASPIEGPAAAPSPASGASSLRLGLFAVLTLTAVTLAF